MLDFQNESLRKFDHDMMLQLKSLCCHLSFTPLFFWHFLLNFPLSHWITGSADGTVKLFQISGKRLLQTFRHSEPQLIDSNLRSIPEQQPDDDEDNMDVEETEELTVSSVECVGFSNTAEYRWIASGGLDKTMKIWDSVNGVCRSVLNYTNSQL